MRGIILHLDKEDIYSNINGMKELQRHYAVPGVATGYSYHRIYRIGRDFHANQTASSRVSQLSPRECTFQSWLITRTIVWRTYQSPIWSQRQYPSHCILTSQLKTRLPWRYTSESGGYLCATEDRMSYETADAGRPNATCTFNSRYFTLLNRSYLVWANITTLRCIITFCQQQ